MKKKINHCRNIMMVLASMASWQVFAEPVYLDCKDFEVKLDEDSGKITHSSTDGSSFNADGFFSAETVSYQKVDAYSSAIFKDVYTISRVDLSWNREYSGGPIDTASMPKSKYPQLYIEERQSGNCSVKEVKKRAF